MNDYLFLKKFFIEDNEQQRRFASWLLPMVGDCVGLSPRECERIISHHMDKVAFDRLSAVERLDLSKFLFGLKSRRLRR